MIDARAVVIDGKGDADVLQLGTLAVREPGPGEVRVAIAAAGLNRADVLQRRGFYPAPKGAPSHVPGLEYAGTVESVGEGVSTTAVGARVMGIVAGGGMASHVVVHERELLRVPDALSIEDAAAIPEVFMTAYDALFPQGGLGLGQTALLHAIGSGIGTAALQLVRATGARALGTSRTEDKLARCVALGLDPQDGFWVHDKRFAARVLERTAGRGADVILDTVGASYLAENLQALAPLGRMVVIGLLGGATAEMPLGALLAKRAVLRGSVLRSRSLEEKAELAQSFTRAVIPLFERGVVRPIVDCVLPMSDVAEAHRRLERDQSFGKIVLRW